ncbi:hypothetical protein BBO_06433 [Beauveria brongniartii RCEF 3172]|uniref:Uncharacterized protein n=1 Tax=Beauveria brongniartii RCEF 3172 TaxID=1081107 RepID=A0A167BD51_9HYPO|nr:hypothetical protein BBO_06433 [Beauveria brongniartii RCEF 3172]
MELAEEEEEKTQLAAATRANGLSPQKRDQSRDLLLKLARVTSASPAERDPGTIANPSRTGSRWALPGSHAPDRIKAKERLFMPLNNYSERGLVRAPSPWVDEDNSTTPKPVVKDFLSMPTPRATGAFINTPITINKKEDRVP